ncbi:hypothetical protein J4208_05690 [Candidatus Woesearchaeota archaeon]|nr:hypothetical protein [Candidatus Woesearchaeota archaeon]
MHFVKPFFIVFALLTLGFLIFTETPEVDATQTVNKTQAVCNTSPVKGTYTEDGCKAAFRTLAPTLCKRGEIATVISCTVNADACVNTAGTGRWCTCKYTCATRI